MEVFRKAFNFIFQVVKKAAVFLNGVFRSCIDTCLHGSEVSSMKVLLCHFQHHLR